MRVLDINVELAFHKFIRVLNNNAQFNFYKIIEVMDNNAQLTFHEIIEVMEYTTHLQHSANQHLVFVSHTGHWTLSNGITMAKKVF